MTRTLKNAILDVDLLKIDEAYQRLVVPRQVKRIVDNYNEVAFGRILVGLRADGEMWVVDGQQRLTATIQMGMKKVPCLLFDSLGRADEAGMFVMYNAHRAGVQPMDIFRAAVQAGDKEMCSLLACVESCGFAIRRGGESPYAIQCVNQLIEIWRAGGPDLIRETLGVIKDVWGSGREATHNLVIAGLAVFCRRLWGLYSRKRLVKCLKASDPLDLMRYAKDAVRITGTNSARIAFSAAVLAIYNRGLRKGRLAFETAPTEDE